MSEFFKEITKALQRHIIEHANFEKHLYLMIDKENIPTVIRHMKRINGRLMTMVGNDERELNKHFKLYYVFAFDDEQAMITVETSLSEADPTFPSMTEQFPAFNWYEREVKDLFGLKPVGHPTDKPLILLQSWPEGNYPLRKDYPVDRMQEQI